MAVAVRRGDGDSGDEERDLHHCFYDENYACPNKTRFPDRRQNFKVNPLSEFGRPVRRSFRTAANSIQVVCMLITTTSNIERGRGHFHDSDE